VAVPRKGAALVVPARVYGAEPWLGTRLRRREATLAARRYDAPSTAGEELGSLPNSGEVELPIPGHICQPPTHMGPRDPSTKG